MINYKQLLYFDIETTSEYETFSDFENNNIIGSKSFKLKYDRAQKRENSQWSGTIDEAYINNAPLLAEYGKIICISYGMFINDEYKVSSKSLKNYISEKELIEFIAKLFNKIEQKYIYPCGHNIKGFDIPFIFKKMLKYSIKIPKNLNVTDKKPWEINMYDTGDLTKGTGFVASSLADVTYLLGLTSPKDDIDGSEVHHTYWIDNDIDRIVKYCEKDVIAIKDICVRLYECLE